MEQPSVATKKRKTGPVREGRNERPAPASAGSFWLYGLHSARAALSNPRRKIRRVLVTDRAQIELGQALVRCGFPPTPAAPDNISRMLPPGAVHQGVALLCEPLPPLDLEDALPDAKPGARLVAALNQAPDPPTTAPLL